jgi:phosphatidate phosphatase APP1
MSQKIVFAPSVASTSDADHWLIVIQGRIFEAAGDGIQAVADEILGLVAGADRKDPLFRARVGCFVSKSIKDARVSVALGDRVVQLAPSDLGGYFVASILLTNNQVGPTSHDGVITFESLPMADSAGRFSGSAVQVPDEGVIVVSDMDDTIKVTNVNNHAEARQNTLVLPFRPVDGMPELYSAWKASDPSVHFHIVSAGPWQFHEPLRVFTEEAGFPAFTWDMRSLDTTDPNTLISETVEADPERLFNFKVPAIRALMTRFPKRHVILVGDSGERDPEIYAQILAEFADHVDAILIHNVRDEDQTDRYKKLFPTQGMAAKLRVFVNPNELPHSLAAIG